jgi:Tol biopolymer transport system component
MQTVRLTLYPLPVCLLLCLTLLAAGCSGGDQKVETRTVVVGPPIEQGNANSSQPQISADGRFVVFTSEATNLLKSPTLGRAIFIRELESGVVTLVSSSSAGEEGNGDSESPSVSADGRYVVFESGASDLVEGDVNESCISAGGTNTNCMDVFMKDTQSGATTLVSSDSAGVQGDGHSQRPAISGDGRFVAFTSSSTSLVADDGNGAADIFIKDTRSGALEVVSSNAAWVPGNRESDLPSISTDGRFVAFKSLADDLVEGDVNGVADVYLKDIQTGAVALVSADAAGVPGNAASGFDSLAMSGDGRFVIFESEADDLVEGDVNGKRDVFLKDMQSGAIALVSTDTAGVQADDDSYTSVAVTTDGVMAFFSSNANNLVPGDTMNKPDLFRKNTQTGVIDIISTDSTGIFGDGASDSLSITPEGFLVVFSSDASNLIPEDTNNKTDIFLKDTQTGETVIISTSTA